MQRAAAIGPDLSHRRTIVTQVLRAGAVRRAMAEEMRSKKISRREALRLGQDYAAEIAANYSHVFIAIMARVLTWFWTRLYDGVELHHFDQLQKLADGNEIVYVPCHRSHIDYLLMSYAIYFKENRSAARRGRRQSQHAGARPLHPQGRRASTFAAASRATRCTRWCS